MLQLPTYPFHRPDELDRPRAAPHPVLVVGGGLTGLSLALDLARRGIAVTLLDDDNTVGVRGLASRGMVWAQRTLDILGRLGVAERLCAKGVAWNVGRVLCRDQPVHAFALQPEADTRQLGFVNLQQYYVEQFLAEALMATPGAELRWLNRVTGLRRDPASGLVELDVETPEGGYRTRAQWVVACDGAHSAVRQMLGLTSVLHDRTEDRWIIVDVIVRNRSWPEERWTWLDAGANQGRAVWRHKMADDTWRLDFQLAPHEDADQAATEPAMRARVHALLGDDLDFDIAWHGTWGYRHECLDRLRHGRVLFAGDAAHLVAPFGARGGNGGIQDADNLGWKLALHLLHGAPEALLDSYDHERKQAALDNIRQARRSARFVYPGDQASAALWRNAIIALAPTQPGVARFINTGRLSTPCAYAPSALAQGRHPMAGQALPDVVLRRGAGGAPAATLHGLLGPWFTGLVMADRLPAGLPEHPLLRWQRVGPETDPAGRAALARRLGTAADDGTLWLLRPDQHVLAVLPAGAHDAVWQALQQALRQATAEAPART